MTSSSSSTARDAMLTRSARPHVRARGLAAERALTHKSCQHVGGARGEVANMRSGSRWGVRVRALSPSKRCLAARAARGVLVDRAYAD